MKLSVLMPAYNEERTIRQAIKAVLDVEFPCDFQLVVVDDGSTDSTAEIVESFRHPALVMCRHPRNRGKGAAIRTAAVAADGDYMVICDADLEYWPHEIPMLLSPIIERRAEVVYGTRSFGSHTAYSFWYVMANLGLNFYANLLFNCWMSDINTCFKLLPLSLYRELDVSADGFGADIEITAKLLKRGVRPFEVPISYRARSREEGKKVTWRDGVTAVRILSRVRLARSEQPSP